MDQAACGHAPAIRRQSDTLTDLLRRLDQHRRAAKLDGLCQLEADIREACRLLLCFRWDEESLHGGCR
jgi:hypothetical protein